MKRVRIILVLLLAGVIDDVNGNITLTSASAGLSWFVADNFSIGARFSYAHRDIDINNLSMLSLISLSNKHFRRETYSGSIIYFDEFKLLY